MDLFLTRKTKETTKYINSKNVSSTLLDIYYI